MNKRTAAKWLKLFLMELPPNNNWKTLNEFVIFFKNMEQEKTMETPASIKQELLQKLLLLKNDYSDEMTEEILSSVSSDSRHKERKGWFGAVVGDLGSI